MVAYFWLRGERTAAAEQLMAADREWRVPPLWRSEFRNVLAGYLRRGDLDLASATRIAARAEARLRRGERAASSSRVLRLVDGSPLSAYDCEFVALAEDLQVPLVTEDRRLRASFPALARSMSEHLGSP